MYFSAPLATFLLVAASLAAAQAGTAGRQAVTQTTPDLQTIVSRMEQAQLDNHARLIPYRVTREYQFFGGDTRRADSQVIADVSFLPPDQKSYAILQAQGSGRGSNVVQKVLEHEVELARAPNPIPISRKDYQFSLMASTVLDGARCFLLAVTPRREDKSLLQGKLWVDAATYQVRRFEGQPAKSPSWWLKDVNLVFNYGRVGSMWLQTSSEGSANVRLVGRHSMIARDLQYDTGSAVAEKLPPAKLGRTGQRPRRASPQSAVGSAIYR